MDVEQALYERLKAQCPAVANRVAPAPAPEQMNTPLLTYQVLSSPSELTFGGVQPWSQYSFQVTAWADTYDTLIPVVREVQAALNGWQQAWPGFSVQYAWIDNMRDLNDTTFDPPLVGRAMEVILTCE